MRHLLALLLIAPAAAQTPRPPVIHSPEISADRRVTFQLAAPKATEATVAGEFQPGSIPLHKGDQGVWSVTVGPLDESAGAHIWMVWRRYLNEVAPLLFQEAR